MAVRSNQEMGGFKLLEEDALDDRPCPAVKRFVSSILDRKDMKDQEVASSFRSLMEYRDSTSSPSACSVGTYSSTVDAGRINSPPSPSTDATHPGPMDDQRLPNELLDEICEDIGMKEGMELDFVEYLMEQDTNPHMYMTQEAISSTNFHSAPASSISTPCGSTSGGSNNGSDNKTVTTINPPAATTTTATTPNFLFKPTFTDSDWPHPLAMSNNNSSSSNSSGSNTVKSENRSPAHKRVHLSASADVSPNKGQSQSLAGGNQQYGSMAASSCSWFKMPQPGMTTTRPGQSYFHAAPTPSPVQSAHSSSSQGSGSSYHPSHSQGNSRSQELSLPHKFQSGQPGGQLGSSAEQEGASSSNGHLPTRCQGSSSSSSKNMCGMSPKPAALPCEFGKSSSPHHFNLLPGSARNGDGLGDRSQLAPHVFSSHPQHNHLHHQQQRVVASAQIQINPNMPGTFFNKGICPPGSYQTQHVQINHHRPGMANLSAHHHPQIRTPVDSPLDQGYFSNESAGNCSSSSAASPAFTSSSMSSLSATSTILPADHSQKVSQKGSLPQQQQIPGQTGCRPSQKTVHFADMTEGSPPAYPGSPGSMSLDMKQAFNSSSAALDCSFEMDSNGQPKVMPSGKILPRFNHSMKSGIAPYTVPNSQGQVMVPAASPGYDVTSRPSCAVSCGSGPNDVTELTFKSSHMGCSGNGAFFVDNNQNMMRVDSMHGYSPYPPPLVSSQTGEFIHSGPDQPHFGEGSYPMHHQQQQQMCHPQQETHQMSSAESALSLQQHNSHLQPMQQHPRQHQFSSCCLSSQGMNTEADANHQKSMQITNTSTPGYQNLQTVSSHTNNTHLGGPYGGQACPPPFDSANGQVGHSDVFAGQPTHGQGMPGHQEPASFHRGWRTGVMGPEELQVQVGGVHPGMGPVKGGLQLSNSHTISHMQPNPAPNCSASMGPGPHLQDLNMMNSGIHANSPMGPQHPHVGPSYPHMGPHPEYGPCSGLSCNACKMAHPSQHPHHMGPPAGPDFKPTHPSEGPFHPHTLPHMGPCAGPGCAACKLNQTSRPQILSSQQKFIQHLIMDEGNSAYRSHPLFPLLRDLVIAEMNFDNPRFHYQQLLSLLPNDFNKLLQNFLHRNPPSGHYQSNHAVESVIMDSLRLAHGNLLDKIRHRQELEQAKVNSSATLRTMEEFCHKFDHTVNGPMQGGPLPPNGMGSITLNHHPMGAYHENHYIQPGVGHVYHSIKDRPDMFGDPSLASPQASKAESKKHPSLPKEAVAMMMEWLRSHKDNPYPNDDEKALLIKQTGLSVNQINYWFTNARRRILPKWSQCKT